MRPVRVAALEVSHWHSVHDPSYLRQLRRMPEVALVGVQDPDAAVAAKRAAEVGNPPAFTDFRRMLEETRPDFVLALGRHSAMAEKAHWLLDHGFPFLMEKPMGIDPEEVLGIAEKARARNAFVTFPAPMRYTPFYAQARATRLGTLSHVYVRINGLTSARYGGWDCGWMYDPAQAGGGALLNLGVHGFDLFCALTSEAAEVTGAQISARIHERAVEDYGSALVRTPSGVLGTIEAGSTFPARPSNEAKGPGASSDAEFKILGSEAMVLAVGADLRVVTKDMDRTVSAVPSEPPSYLLLRDAIERWQEGRPPAADAGDCYRAVRLVHEAYRAARR